MDDNNMIIDLDPDYEILDESDDNDDDCGSHVSEMDFNMDDIPPDDWTINAKKRKKIEYEKNPALRNKQNRRLLQKLYQTVCEYSRRIGTPAVIVMAKPSKTNSEFRVFGAKPLSDVIRGLKEIVMNELQTDEVEELSSESEPEVHEDDEEVPKFHLPPLVIEGVPTPVERMTQAQLRAFIPLMLKYSLGRGKPGWGLDSTRPQWWPKDLPWENVRMDSRTDAQKAQLGWTEALRKVVINCYKFHGRADLLPKLSGKVFCKPARNMSNPKVLQQLNRSTKIPNTDFTDPIEDTSQNDLKEVLMVSHIDNDNVETQFTIVEKDDNDTDDINLPNDTIIIPDETTKVNDTNSFTSNMITIPILSIANLNNSYQTNQPNSYRAILIRPPDSAGVQSSTPSVAIIQSSGIATNNSNNSTEPTGPKILNVVSLGDGTGIVKTEKHTNIAGNG